MEYSLQMMMTMMDTNCFFDFVILLLFFVEQFFSEYNGSKAYDIFMWFEHFIIQNGLLLQNILSLCFTEPVRTTFVMVRCAYFLAVLKHLRYVFLLNERWREKYYHGFLFCNNCSSFFDSCTILIVHWCVLCLVQKSFQAIAFLFLEFQMISSHFINIIVTHFAVHFELVYFTPSLSLSHSCNCVYPEILFLQQYTKLMSNFIQIETKQQQFVCMNSRSKSPI